MVTRRGVIALAAVAALVVVAWPIGLAGWAFAAGNLVVLAAIAADWLAAEPGAIELERPQPEPSGVRRSRWWSRRSPSSRSSSSASSPTS